MPRSMPKVKAVIKYPFSLDGVRYAPTDQIVRWMGKEEFERTLKYDNLLSVERCEGDFFDQLEMRYGTKFAMQFYGREFMSEKCIAWIQHRLDGMAQLSALNKDSIHYHARRLYDALEKYKKIFPYRVEEDERIDEALDIVKWLKVF